MAVTTGNVRRELVSQFNDPPLCKLHPSTPSEECLLLMNGVGDEDVETDSVPGRPPPPLPPRSPGSPIRVSAAEVGGYSAADRDGKLESLERELAVLREERAVQAKSMKNLQRKLGKYEAIIKGRKGNLRRWQRTQPSVTDLSRQHSYDHLDDIQELIAQFVESERLYLNELVVIDSYFYQPLKMMAVFKPDILSTLQLETLFLNSPQLLVVHQILHTELNQLKSLPKDARMEDFLLILERSLPSFSLYGSFLVDNRSQILQKELRNCRLKKQFDTVLAHQEEKCGGLLHQLLLKPTDRMTDYVTLLKPFLEKTRVRVSESVYKRIEGLTNFLNSIKLDLLDEKSPWECTLEKVTKVLHKLHPDGPIPLDVFDSSTQLVKQGQIAQVVKGKEMQKQCHLFTNYVAMADKRSDGNFAFRENAMWSLAGATLYQMVDMEGQVMQHDLQSGLQQDRMAFRINFPSLDHMVLRVARPNELSKWVEAFEKCIKDSQELDVGEDGGEVVIPDVELKIAAASLEKLFQQLTNPQIGRREGFMDVFLTTYPCFTTSGEVLTALKHCIDLYKEKTPEPSSCLPQSTDHVFTFTMDDNNTLDNADDAESISSTSGSLHNDSSGSDSDSSPTTSRKSSKVTNSTQQVKERLPKFDQARSATAGVLPRNLARGSLSTDSDSSPYTSGVPVSMAEGKEPENGWQERDLSPRPDSTTKELSSLRITSPETVQANRRSRESGSLADSEPDDGFVMVNSDMTTSRSAIELDNDWDDLERCTRATQDSLVSSRSSNDLIRSTQSVRPPVTSISSQNLDLYETPLAELEESTQLMSSVLSDLCTPIGSPRPGFEDCFDYEEDAGNFRRYTGSPLGFDRASFGSSRRRRATENLAQISEESGRLSSSSLSHSQPDLTLNSIQVPMSTLSQNTLDSSQDELTSSLPASRRMMVQPYTEHDPLSLSLSFSGKDRKSKPTDLSSSARFMSKFSKRDDKKSKRTRDSAKVSDPVEPPSYQQTSSLYFGEQTTGFTKQSSPSRFSNLFRRKSKDTKRSSPKPSPRASVDQTDFDTPKSTAWRGQRRPTAPNVCTAPTYMNLSPLNGPKGAGRVSDLPPSSSPHSSLTLRRQSSLSVRNLYRAEKIFTVLRKWIRNHPEDFEEDEELTQKLKGFLKDLILQDAPEARLAEDTLRAIPERSRERRESLSFRLMLTRVTKLDPTMLDQYDWDKPAKLIVGKDIDLSKSSKDVAFAKMFAEQITIMEYCCYSAIQRSELLNCQWKKKDKAVKAPNLIRMITRTNEMTSWVCTEILSRESPSARATVIEHLINMARTCFRHNDMHCALSITLALKSTPIKRLTKTWDSVDRRCKQRFEKLKDVTDLQEKCRKLREQLEIVTTESVEKTGKVPPCLPYVGAYLDMIYSLEIGVETYNSNGLVNFSKMTKLAEVIDSVLQYQQSPYEFEPRLDIIAYVTAAKRLSENELYDLSLQREPSHR